MPCSYLDNLCQRKDTPTLIKENYCNGDKFYRCKIYEEIIKKLDNFLTINKFRLERNLECNPVL